MVKVEDIKVGKIYQVHYYSIEEHISVVWDWLLCYDVIPRGPCFYDLQLKAKLGPLIQYSGGRGGWHIKEII